MKKDPGVFYVRFLFLLQENGHKFSLSRYLKTYTNKCKLCKFAKHNHFYFNKYLELPIVKFKLLYNCFLYEPFRLSSDNVVIPTLPYVQLPCRLGISLGSFPFFSFSACFSEGDVLVCLQTPNAWLWGSRTAACLAVFAVHFPSGSGAGLVVNFCPACLVWVWRDMLAVC